MNQNAKLLEKFKKLPFGLWLFTRAICWKAPYFSSIKPLFLRLEPGHGEALLKKRRQVQNHIGTVHAIAMANLCELVAGTTLEITIPSTHRWIPKSMKINYVAKAATDVTAKTELTPGFVWPDTGSLEMPVTVTDTRGNVVVTAEIEMHISRKK